MQPDQELSREDLVENYNIMAKKCKYAIDRANKAIIEKGCIEIELATLKEEYNLLKKKLRSN
jgi:hypothetical protein